MEKALEILKEIKNKKPFIYRLTSVWCRALVVNEPSKLDEAIAELEALQSRSCEGCKHLYLSQYNEYVDYCNDLNIEIAHNNISTFYCQGYEAKEQL